MYSHGWQSPVGHMWALELTKCHRAGKDCERASLYM